MFPNYANFFEIHTFRQTEVERLYVARLRYTHSASSSARVASEKVSPKQSFFPLIIRHRSQKAGIEIERYRDVIDESSKSGS